MAPSERVKAPNGYRLTRDLVIEPELGEELTAEGTRVIRVHRHDPPGSEVLASQHRACPGGPPAPRIAAPDVPPGEFGHKLRELFVPPSHDVPPRSGTSDSVFKMNVHPQGVKRPPAVPGSPAGRGNPAVHSGICGASGAVA